MALIEGDGIGPEISQSVKDIFSAAGVRNKVRSHTVTPELMVYRYQLNGTRSMLLRNSNMGGP